MPCIAAGPKRDSIAAVAIRRGADIALSLGGLLALLPLLLAVALLIRILDGSPVLFSQIRIGAGGKPFRLWKFRSMRVAKADGAPKLTSDGDTRVTPLGAILRRYKVDEFPQLWNVLLGQMSIVGPRPEVPEYVDLENPLWTELLHVKPGITDLATLVYRHEEKLLGMSPNPTRTYLESVLPHKLGLDREYLRHQTLWTDLKLIVLTLRHSFSSAPVDEPTIRRRILGGDSWNPDGPFLFMSLPSAKRRSAR